MIDKDLKCKVQPNISKSKGAVKTDNLRNSNNFKVSSCSQLGYDTVRVHNQCVYAVYVRDSKIQANSKTEELSSHRFQASRHCFHDDSLLTYCLTSNSELSNHLHTVLCGLYFLETLGRTFHLHHHNSTDRQTFRLFGCAVNSAFTYPAYPMWLILSKTIQGGSQLSTQFCTQNLQEVGDEQVENENHQYLSHGELSTTWNLLK